MVALAYISNPENKPEVNHKDENKLNNSVNNLEWMTRAENNNYGTRTERMAKAKSKAIYCVELDKIFIGANEAARQLGLSQGNITMCCQGKRKTTGGYHFQYYSIN